MIAVDTAILVYAYRPSVPQYDAARRALAELASSGQRWVIPWPCVHEFVSVVSNRRFGASAPASVAVDAINALVAGNDVVFLGESRRHLEILGDLVTTAGVDGAVIHDAKIAAICLGHGVDELWTADRDYGYFPALRTRNPLVGDGRR